MLLLSISGRGKSAGDCVAFITSGGGVRIISPSPLQQPAAASASSAIPIDRRRRRRGKTIGVIHSPLRGQRGIVRRGCMPERGWGRRRRRRRVVLVLQRRRRRPIVMLDVTAFDTEKMLLLPSRMRQRMMLRSRDRRCGCGVQSRRCRRSRGRRRRGRLKTGLLLLDPPGNIGQSARGQQPRRLPRRQGSPLTRKPLGGLRRRPLRQDGGRGRRRGREGDGLDDERGGGRRGVHHGRRHRAGARRGRRGMRQRWRRRDVGYHVLHGGGERRHFGSGRGRHGQPRSQDVGLVQTHCGIGRQLLVRRPVVPARLQLVRATLGVAVLVLVGPGGGGEGHVRRLRGANGTATGPRGTSSARESNLVADAQSLGSHGRCGHHRPRAAHGCSRVGQVRLYRCRRR